MGTKRQRRPAGGGRPGLSRLAVCGYKSICQEQAIVLRPLTVLAGANSSGKSSMMQPLLLLKQTLEAPFDPGALLLDGPNVRLTSAEQLACRVPGSCPSMLSMELGLADGDTLGLGFKRIPGMGMEIDHLTHVTATGDKTALRPGMSHQEIEAILPEHLRRLREDMSGGGKWDLHWVVSRDRCFLFFGLAGSGKVPRSDWLARAFSPAVLVGPLIEQMIHVPGLRGNPERTYKTTAVGQTFPGTFEAYIASIISHWQSTGDPKLQELSSVLEDLGLTWKVEAKPLDDTRVELRVGRMPHAKRGGAYDLVSIADVGFGVSQTLPVLVALLAARPGQIVYLEQPEIHLHPRAQRRLADVLAKVATRGVVTVVETHSALLVRGIQTQVARGELSPSLVGLHWFQREAATGATQVTAADLDPQGAFGDWPEDFDDVALQAEQDYLDAVEKRGVAV
ncbi:MAG: AAA family ATPase [Thermodesulfobacteriota bacterium]